MSDLSISLVQTDPHWEDVSSNLELFEKKIKTLDSGQVVVLPEMFNTGFSMNATALSEDMEGATVSWMKKMAGEKNIILTGSLIVKAEEQYFNRLLWVLPNGSVAQYDKRHLFSFAGEDAVFTAGTSRLIAQVKGWHVGLFICYDLRFPVWLRQLKDAQAQYELLIIVANWPASRNEQWDSLLQARAIENQCFVAGLNRVGMDGNHLNYNGHSALFDFSGKVVKQMGNTDGILTHTFKKEALIQYRRQFPFLNDADKFVWKS